MAADTLWKPRSFCANCAGSLRSERLRSIAFCHMHLNDFPAAVRTCLQPVGKKTWDFIFGGDADKLLVRLYTETGQTDDLSLLLGRVDI